MKKIENLWIPPEELPSNSRVIGRNELGSLGSFSLYLPPRSRKNY